MLPAWFTEAEDLKAQTLSRLEAMTPEIRRRAPTPNEWSAEQIVGHLVLVEELLASDWQEAARNAPTAKPGTRGDLLLGVVNATMRSPIRLPTAPFLEPTESGGKNALPVRSDAVRVRIRETIPANPHALWVVHPLFGALSAAQMGAFLAAHLCHHLLHWPTKK